MNLRDTGFGRGRVVGIGPVRRSDVGFGPFRLIDAQGNGRRMSQKRSQRHHGESQKRDQCCSGKSRTCHREIHNPSSGSHGLFPNNNESSLSGSRSVFFRVGPAKHAPNKSRGACEEKRNSSWMPKASTVQGFTPLQKKARTCVRAFFESVGLEPMNYLVASSRMSPRLVSSSPRRLSYWAASAASWASS